MIKLNDINKTYKTGKTSLHVLKGVNLDVEAGELVSIMGSSGSGKSTMLNIVGMLDNYDSGEYYLFSFARKAEQNRVWAGMAKETAHQIGTPLSSIMAWMELLKMKESNAEEAATEIEKDINRLEVITERFSKIGSMPSLVQNDVVRIINESIEYLKPRTPRKVKYNNLIPEGKELFIPVNGALFSWVIENLCKNAIDAMEGDGTITIQLKNDAKSVIIDISDTGKGIAITEQKAIFNPGYTSKVRGWGLGLSLSKRIIRDYHRGKIFVKSSSPGKGSTFRIILRKDQCKQ